MPSVIIYEPKIEGHHPAYLRLTYQALSGCFDRITICSKFSTKVIQRELEPYLDANVERVDVAHLGLKESNKLVLKLSDRFDYLFIPFLSDFLSSLVLWRLSRITRNNLKVGGLLMEELEPIFSKKHKFGGRCLARTKANVLRHLIRFTLPRKMLAPIIFNHDQVKESIRRALPNLLTCPEVVYDPWLQEPTKSLLDVRNKYNIPQNAYVFLHIGTSRPSKGFEDCLAAFEGLVREVEGASVFLLRVGDDTDLDSVLKGRLQVLQDLGHASCISQRVTDEEFVNFLGSADCVVLPYRDHRASSGVLSAAIGARADVIMSDYGFLGWAAREWSYGRLHKHADVDSLRSAMRISYEENAQNSGFNERLREELSPERFVGKVRGIYARELGLL